MEIKTSKPANSKYYIAEVVGTGHKTIGVSRAEAVGHLLFQLTSYGEPLQIPGGQIYFRHE